MYLVYQTATLLIVIFILGSCINPDQVNESTNHKSSEQDFPVKYNNLKYLALGDSYTIGEGVLPDDSYPQQTRDKLLHYNLDIEDIEIIAKTGWTSGELLGAMDLQNIKEKNYDFVTLLIGVNNQYRGQLIDQYEQDLRKLLTFAIELTNDKNNRITVISIPDWGVTSFGASATHNPEHIANEIDLFNNVNQRVASDFDVNYLNITENYRNIGGLEPNLVDDGLHPSASVYRQWAIALSEIMYQNFHSKSE